MKTEFDVKIKTGDMYRFLMYHSYHSVQGIFSVLAAAALIVLYFVVGKTTTNGFLFLIFGVLFAVYIPWNLYMSAAKIVRLGTVYKEPIHYCLTENGIQAVQGEASSEISWDAIYKVRESGKNILVYTTSKNASIWVKSQLGSSLGDVKQMLKQHVAKEKQKLK